MKDKILTQTLGTFYSNWENLKKYLISQKLEEEQTHVKKVIGNYNEKIRQQFKGWSSDKEIKG